MSNEYQTDFITISRISHFQQKFRIRKINNLFKAEEHFKMCGCLEKGIYQGLSNHQEVGSTPVTKVTRLIVNFGTFLVQ